MAFLPLRDAGAPPAVRAAYGSWLDGIERELADAGTDRNELCRRVLTELFYPQYSDVDPATLKSRKAFARRQWRRRWLAWRYLIVGTLVIALLLGGIWAVYFSTWLQVKGTSVHGSMKMTSAKEVVEFAAVPVGELLATADETFGDLLQEFGYASGG